MFRGSVSPPKRFGKPPIARKLKILLVIDLKNITLYKKYKIYLKKFAKMKLENKPLTWTNECSNVARQSNNLQHCLLKVNVNFNIFAICFPMTIFL